MKILGLVDIIGGLLFVASFYGLAAPHGLMVTIGVLLILKGVLFIANVFSWGDIAAGVLLTFNLAQSITPIVLIIAAAFLTVKGLVSLFSFS